MADVMSPKQRSRCMSRIKGKDTKPELVLRRALWAQGLRYRLNYKLPGRPDIVFIGARVVVFVDGCFWHGCPIHSVQPKSNVEFWKSKLSGNKERDLLVSSRLEAMGWRVLRFWEHEISEELGAVVQRVSNTLQKAVQANDKGE